MQPLEPCCLRKQLPALIADGGTHAAFSHSDWCAADLIALLAASGERAELVLALPVVGDRTLRAIANALATDAAARVWLLVQPSHATAAIRLMCERFGERLRAGVYPFAGGIALREGYLCVVGAINDDTRALGAPLRLYTASGDNALTADFARLVKARIERGALKP